MSILNNQNIDIEKIAHEVNEDANKSNDSSLKMQ